MEMSEEKVLERLGAAAANAAGVIAANNDVGGDVESSSSSSSSSSPSSSSSSDDDDGFVDAMYESLEHQPRHPQPPQLQRLGSNNYGILEDCGRWLMAIPRDDVVALQQTPEYGEFLSAFGRLGEVRDARASLVFGLLPSSRRPTDLFPRYFCIRISI